MKYIDFKDATPNDNIVEIHYDTCNDSVICKLLHVNSQGYWWGIFSNGLPTRYICVKTYHSLMKFATRYGYMDKNDCVNYKSGKFGIVTKFEPPKEYYDSKKTIDFLVSRNKQGVPQKSLNSGLCWYCAMCFACFFCKQMRSLIKYYSNDRKLNELIDICLDYKDKAEELRHHLFYTYNIGDDPNQNPEDDGQNGLSEFLSFCAQLNIPVVRLFAPSLSELKTEVLDKKDNVFSFPQPKASKPCLLVVRCFRTRWRAKLRITHEGIRYKLTSVMIGSEHCGHQIGASTCDLRVCRWACADADACKEGIGPMYWNVKKYREENIKTFVDRWWDVWGKMIPVTLFNSNSFCDFSPHNRSTCKLESNMKSDKTCTDFNAGVVNSDFIYIHEPN